MDAITYIITSPTTHPPHDFSSPYSTSNICHFLSGTEPRFSGAHKRGKRGLGPANQDRQNFGSWAEPPKKPSDFPLNPTGFFIGILL